MFMRISPPTDKGSGLSYAKGMTCAPTKTDPKAVIGFSKNGGRKWQSESNTPQNNSY
jgi:hypothetical protein